MGENEIEIEWVKWRNGHVATFPGRRDVGRRLWVMVSHYVYGAWSVGVSMDGEITVHPVNNGEHGIRLAEDIIRESINEVIFGVK
jgi:hypothetical protein